MFRLQENVPEVYVKESRDFQLFCRLYDIVNNAGRFNAKSTSTLLDPVQCNDRMLQLLATKVGFFPKSEYNTHALRLIISAFPYMMKYKGSKKGIEIAVNTVLKAENNYTASKITFNKANGEIAIYTLKPIINELLLEDVLSYVIPIGYTIEIGYYKELSNPPTSQINLFDVNQDMINYSANISKILSVDDLSALANEPKVQKDSTGNYVVTEVVSAEAIIRKGNQEDPIKVLPEEDNNG